MARLKTAYWEIDFEAVCPTLDQDLLSQALNYIKGSSQWQRQNTVTTRMTPALRWAVMRDFLMFHYCEGQSHNTVSTNHHPFVEKGESKRNRTEVLLLTSLTPYR